MVSFFIYLWNVLSDLFVYKINGFDKMNENPIKKIIFI